MALLVCLLLTLAAVAALPHYPPLALPLLWGAWRAGRASTRASEDRLVAWLMALGGTAAVLSFFTSLIVH